MTPPGGFQAFMRQYFPVFLLGFFASLFSLALAVTLWVDEHWRNHPDNPLYSLLSMGALVLLLCLGHFGMIRGHAWALWPAVVVPVIAIGLMLSLLGSGLNSLLLLGLLALPLIALGLFASARHREMRRRLVQLRQQR